MKPLTTQPVSLGLSAFAAGCLLLTGPVGCRQPSRDSSSLHALAREGYAQLENENPSEAVDTFTALRQQLPEDPLPHGNLALALLRSEQAEEAQAAIEAGVERFPDHPGLLSIRATVEHWRGDLDQALESARRAADLATEDPQIQFSLYRIADQVGASGHVATALDRLSRLRPENLVVLLTLGKNALATATQEPESARAEASRAYLRVQELVWDNPAAQTVLEQLLQALADNWLQDTRTPATQLENLLKITPAYQRSLSELEIGIQGIPLRTLTSLPEPEPAAAPAELTFTATSIDAESSSAVGVMLAGEGDEVLVVNRSAGGVYVYSTAGAVASSLGLQLGRADLDNLLLADLDNDGTVDLILSGAGGVEIILGSETGLETWTDNGVTVAQVSDAVSFDYDVEGDLDLAVGTDAGVRLYRNALDGPLTDVTDHAGELASGLPVTALHAVDLDLDGDLDLAGIEGGRLVLWPNLRQGQFSRRELAPDGGQALASGDFDSDGRFELVVGGDDGIRVIELVDGEPATAIELAATGVRALAAGDVDADGRRDLLAAGTSGVTLWQNTGEGFADPVTVFDQPANDLALADTDRDCDLDLLVAADSGLYLLETRAEPQYHCLRVKLRGLTEGSSKNNVLGLGSLVEVAAGDLTGAAEVQHEETFFGLGDAATADILRVLWTNGVPQNRFDVAADQTVVEEQLLKGSCPFLYAWDGERFAFVTDLLWGSPAGLPVVPGVWADADPSELVHIPGAVPRDGKLELRITEELWEAAFFDHLRLWVVEVDRNLEVASSLKIHPGRSTPEKVLATADVEPVVEARDARGRDVTGIVAARDETYADGWEPSPYQGVPVEPWTLEFALGRSPEGPVRLLLDGWIFPSDASLNLAVAQRDDLVIHGPRIEVFYKGQWQTLAEDVGFPAGKTKTMVVDLPPLPPGASRLRLVAAQWLSFDRIAWSPRPADHRARVTQRLLASEADLHYRGYSRMVRRAPNAPHAFDYHTVDHRAPWLAFPGRYTRYGNVRELLAEVDDRSVIMAAGDEIRLAFDLDLRTAPAGKRYEYFLESHGWDKDADRNTYAAAQVEPLPFRAMSGYPYGPDESFPDTPEHRAYRRDWLTRKVVASGQ